MLVSTAGERACRHSLRCRNNAGYRIVMHGEAITVGTSSTAPVNSRIVRPAKIRAMNIPVEPS